MEDPAIAGENLLDHVLVPLANAEDARDTARSMEGCLGDRVTLVFVVEKGEGAPDKTPVEQSERMADRTFEAFREESSCGNIESTVTYGRDVVAQILETAAAVDATAIAFRPRGGSRITQWLAGDRSLQLVTETDRPVIALPDPGDS